MMSVKRNTIQDNVFNACLDQRIDEDKSNFLSTYHTHKYLEDMGFKITRQQVRSAFYSLTQKGLLEKRHHNIWIVP